MKVIIVSDTDEMGQVGGALIANDMATKAHYVLGLATGSTPVTVYKDLIRRHKEEGLDFSRVITFNLDEYVGIDGDHDQSYRYFMNVHLFDHININKKATHVPDGMAVDIEANAEMKKNALLVPADAVVEEATETFVYVVREGRARKAVVETGFSNYTQTEITAGLSPGDVVVVSGKDELGDGVKIRARPAHNDTDQPPHAPEAGA